MGNAKRRRLWALFAAYCLVTVWLLFGRRLGWDNPVPYTPGVNLRPLETIRLMWPLLGGEYGRAMQIYAVVNLAGNVALFIPAGVLIPALFRPMLRLWLFSLTSAAVVAAVEGAQYLFHLGSCDVDDLILNVTGMLIGYGLYRFSQKRKKTSSD